MRELDAEVAEKLMGWEIVSRGHRVNRPGRGQIVGFKSKADAREFIKDDCPKYSTDIAAAVGYVVKKMREKGWALMIGDDGVDPDVVWFYPIGVRGAVSTSLHLFDAVEDLPEAICRAALEAVQ